MSRRISTKAAESGQTTGEPAADAIAPPVSSATAAEEHHTVVEPEIIEPEILPKQASGTDSIQCLHRLKSFRVSLRIFPYRHTFVPVTVGKRQIKH